MNWFGNATANETVAWPRVRGTSSILTGCLATLLLCSLTPVHLNVPAPGEAAQQSWRKVYWMIMGLLAPEIVAFMAWNQLRSCRLVFKAMRNTFGESVPPTTWDLVNIWVKSTWKFVSRALKRLYGIFRSSPPWPMETRPYGEEGTKMVKVYELENASCISSREENVEAQAGIEQSQKHQWTKLRSWYAVMGGFAIDTRHFQQDFVPGSPEIQTLSPDGLILLARCRPEVIPDISKEEILDKSKADDIKKFLVYGRLCEDIVAFLAIFSHYHGRRELDILLYQPEKASPPRVRFFTTWNIEDESHSTLKIPEHDPEWADSVSELPSDY
ncbi:hypothetical protein QBC38DRAFT_500265 [Podospora fimiseda]|uniref:Uncharacterized protein n=1 Tax=Podospora fimiseda TaxID=252190 RepID=A0AAN7H348_9PEZI|nr:hypothetical protein QBC38DRAFT_500265 [Podospora fimiseda]